jgi:hypothetical protein
VVFSSSSLGPVATRLVSCCRGRGRGRCRFGRSVVEYAARSGQAWHLGRQSQFWDVLDYNVPTGEIYQDQMWNEARTLYM